MDVYLGNKQKKDLKFILAVQLSGLPTTTFFLLALEDRQISKIWKVACDFFFFACEREVVLECVTLMPIA